MIRATCHKCGATYSDCAWSVLPARGIRLAGASIIEQRECVGTHCKAVIDSSADEAVTALTGRAETVLLNAKVWLATDDRTPPIDQVVKDLVEVAIDMLSALKGEA